MSQPIITNARHLLAAQAILGEGAIWHPTAKKLYWVDILGAALHIFDPLTGEDRQLSTGAFIGTVVPVDGSTDVLVALQNGIHYMDTGTGALRLIANPIAGPQVRFNDGKCDPSGRFWVGTLSMDGARGSSHLYRLDRDGSLHEMLNDVSISNGIVWTADRKTMYYNDTPSGTVQAFDYDDATGAIANRRVAIRMREDQGWPDGMCIDAEGCLWIAMWGSGCVNRYKPETGALLQQVQVPAPHVSSCALGGPGLHTLYITTARVELSAEELACHPLSGDLFVADVAVSGVPAGSYMPL